MLDPTAPRDLFVWMRNVDRRLHALATGEGTDRMEGVMLPGRGPYTPPYVEITSASMVPAWERRILNLRADSLFVRVTVSADSGTTGAIRLDAYNDDLAAHDFSDSQAIPAGSLSVYYYRWTPDPDVWTFGGHHRLQLEAQRLTGSGNINVYPPAYLVTTSEEIEPIVAGGIATS